MKSICLFFVVCSLSASDLAPKSEWVPPTRCPLGHDTVGPFATVHRHLTEVGGTTNKQVEELDGIQYTCVTCGAYTPAGDDWHEKEGAILPTLPERCPADHQTIKLVPIRYGMFPMTDKLREQERHFEVVLGGCVIGRMGRWQITCTTCGAHRSENDENWTDGAEATTETSDAEISHRILFCF